MDHLDTNTSDEAGTSAVTTLSNEDSSEDLFDTLANTVSTNRGSSTYPSDIFEDTYSSSTLVADQYDMFFSLDDTAEGSSALGQEAALTLTTMDKGARVEGVSTSSSLFDDLLDFSSPRTSEIDQIILDNTADSKPVPAVDLLFGVDDDLVSPTGFQSQVKAKAPDILDFVDVPYDLPEIASMDATDGLAFESLTDGWDLLTDVSSAKPGLDQSPDVVVTFPGLDTVHDTTDDAVTMTEQQEDSTDGAVEDKHSDNEKHPESADDAKQATDGDVKEKTVDIHHASSETDKMKDSFQDMDFSVLELPGASNLNFDHFKHKRNISQKGSIANRKKPKRSTMQPAGEDSIFMDSTEPKQQKAQNEDVPDSELSLHHSKGEKAQETDGQISQETSPTRKLAGGIKIPGLLEGLSKSKVFTRAEKTSPAAEPESKPENTPDIVNLNSTSNKVKLPTSFIEVTSPVVDSPAMTSPAVTISTVISPAVTPSEVTSPAVDFPAVTSPAVTTPAVSTPAVTTPAVTTPAVTSPAVTSPAVSSPAVTSSPPLIRPKPVVLPRVLPKPDTKTLKESQNQATASGIVARASSFRNATFASGSVDKPSLLASPVALSRSASVKVANTIANKNEDLSSVKEEKSPSVPICKLIPPKPELKKPLSPANLRPVNKTPPPVPVKPSVAAKPNRASLGWSASFSGGKSPLLPAVQSEAKTESVINKEHKPDSRLIVSAEKQSDSTNNTASTEKKYVPDNKPVLSGFSSERKPFSFAQKSKEVSHSKAASEKIDATVNSALEKTDPTVETVKSSSGNDASKNAIFNRIPSVRASLPTGFVARTGFRASENYANLEGKKADNLDADDVFDANADKNVSSVNIADSSNSSDKIDNENNGDEILPRRKSSISGVTPVKSPLTSDKFPASVMPRKGSITGSAYNPIGFRSALGSSDSDQRSRNSSVSSSVEGVVLGTDSANLQPSVTAPTPKPRADSYATSEGQKSRNGSFITTAVEQVRSSPDRILEGGPEKTTKSDTLAETKLISGIISSKGDDKKKDVIETKSDMQKPPRTLRESPSPGRLNGSTAVSKASDKSTSPWNVQLKKVDKKESPKLEPAVKSSDSQPANWRQQLSVKQKISVPPKITEKPKQDNTPEWAKASIKRRQRLIESGVIRGDS